MLFQEVKQKKNIKKKTKRRTKMQIPSFHRLAFDNTYSAQSGY